MAFSEEKKGSFPTLSTEIAAQGLLYLDRRGRIMGWDEEAEAHAKRLVERELQRLRKSFELARAAGFLTRR